MNVHQLIEDLIERPLSVDDIKRKYRIKKQSEVVEYLRKIERICKRKGWAFVIVPGKCIECGFEIRSIKPVSKCPHCKSERIIQPKFYIKKER